MPSLRTPERGCEASPHGLPGVRTREVDATQAKQNEELSLKKLLNAKKLLVPVANFIQATGRFEHGGNQRAEQHQTQERRSRVGNEREGG